MKKRILIAIALIIGLVLIAQTGAWAGKLAAGSEAPAAALGEAGARPKGTDSDYVPTGPNSGAPYVPPAVDLEWTMTDYTGDVPEGAPDGATFKECTESGEDAGDTLTEAHVIEVKGASAVSYWNGSEWVELAVTDGKVTVPAGAPNPVILALVE